MFMFSIEIKKKNGGFVVCVVTLFCGWNVYLTNSVPMNKGTYTIDFDICRNKSRTNRFYC